MMIPKCCDDCKHQWTDEGCSQYHNCVKWRQWVHTEWLRIRVAAALVSGGDLTDKMRKILSEEEAYD